MAPTLVLTLFTGIGLVFLLGEPATFCLPAAFCLRLKLQKEDHRQEAPQGTHSDLNLLILTMN
jgi:hypothetical protein